MNIPAARDNGIGIGAIRDSKLESCIVNAMRRYIQFDPGRPGQSLESAIVGSMERFFEGTHHWSFSPVLSSVK